VKKKKKQIRHLWKTAFGDSDDFIHLYFKQVYKDENALVIEQNGQIVSALQILPYTMTYCGEEIPVAYVSGACTLPAEQGKGLMKKLLLDSFDEMRRREIAVSALIPAEAWLFNYYRTQGYTEIFEYSLKVYTRSEYFVPQPDGMRVERRRKPDAATYAYFGRKLRERPMGILHSYDDFAVIIKDLEVSDGQFFVASDAAGQPVGMAFVSAPDIHAKAGESSVLIKEILYESEEVKRLLLYEITTRCRLLKAIYRIPFEPGLTAYPYAMAQVMDAGRLTALWAAAHPESAVSVAEMQAMPVQTLTRHLLGYADRRAYMSLMLD
jgi:GNAT superfamily N-acetyltransferase